jgi:hypothetical protein
MSRAGLLSIVAQGKLSLLTASDGGDGKLSNGVVHGREREQRSVDAILAPFRESTILRIGFAEVKTTSGGRFSYALLKASQLGTSLFQATRSHFASNISTNHQHAGKALTAPFESNTVANATKLRQGTLPTVYVYGAGNDWFFDDYALWDNILHNLQFSGDFNFDDTSVDRCYEANNEYWAIQDQIDEAEGDSALVAAAIAEANNAVCVGSGRSEGTLCIDAFIQKANVFIIGLGDNRASNPNAPYAASRFQAYLDPTMLDTLTGTQDIKDIIYSPSCLLLPSGGAIPGLTPWCALPDTLDNYARVERLDATTRVVQIHAKNGFCTYWHNAAGDNELCPAIDMVIRVTKTSGQWTIANPATDVSRDGFPVLDIFGKANGQWTSKFHSDETWEGALFTRAKTIQDYLDAQRREMPPGCGIE